MGSVVSGQAEYDYWFGKWRKNDLAGEFTVPEHLEAVRGPAGEIPSASTGSWPKANEQAEPSKGPPAHPSEPAYPCCLPALGGLAR